jgi:hypothetical protein
MHALSLKNSLEVPQMHLHETNDVTLAGEDGGNLQAARVQ